MAHECFEKPAIAESMNARFVNIKLDREERPDIDHVFQLAHQAMSGRGGGWPLTVFLDPQDLTPFFIGTYFPPTPRHGLPGFPEVLERVRDYFDTHREELRTQSGQLREWLQRAQAGSTNDRPDAETTAGIALQRIAARFDPEWGGTRGAPKFPHAAELEWLLDIASDENEGAAGPDANPAVRAGKDGVSRAVSQREKAKRMAQLTLATMATRGLQDHLGGGFFRYCVDADWTIPHFEKMLYDNAQLLPLYARLARAYENGHDARLARAYESEHAARIAATDAVDAELRTVARAATSGIVDWLDREMTAPDGAFYSSLDADSEGEEGRFYLWTRKQFRAAFPDGEFALAEAAFGVDVDPNFEGHAWHLLRATPIADLASRSGKTLAEMAERLDEARGHLLDARSQHTRPSRDDKILTAWNALTISGLARTARLLDDERCADLATRALSALRESAWIDGELFANIAEPATRIPGFLDDHALLLDALLEMTQLAFDPRDLDWAIALADSLLAKFEDRDNRGFWFSTAQHATPLARGRSFTDDALPNGNGMAILGLLRLGHLLGRSDYLDAAERALGAAAGALGQYPDACPTLLRALREYDSPRRQIVIRCTREQGIAWQAALRDAGAMASSGADIFIIPSEFENLPGVLAARNTIGDEGTAWICEGTSCRAPVNSPSELAVALPAHASSGLRP